MNNHPISELLSISMNNLKDMIDVDTIIGDAVNVNADTTLIPISKVKTAFLTGGTDQGMKKTMENIYPFGGATGGTVSITPIGFIVIHKEEIKVLHLEEKTSIYERIIDQIPELIDSVKELIDSKMEKTQKKDENWVFSFLLIMV